MRPYHQKRERILTFVVLEKREKSKDFYRFPNVNITLKERELHRYYVRIEEYYDAFQES